MPHAPPTASRRRHHPALAAAGDVALPSAPVPAYLPNACAVLSVLVAAKGLASLVAPELLLGRSMGAAAATPLNVALMGACVGVTWTYAGWLMSLRVRFGLPGGVLWVALWRV